MRKSWALCGLLLAIPASAAPIYKIVQDVPITSGRLQILEDVRLSRSLEKQLWGGCVDPAYVLGDDDPAAKPFIDKPLVPAKLRQLDANGTTVLEVVLEQQAPIARIEKQTLGIPSDPIVMVRTDDDACMGSYSGQDVAFYDFVNGHLTLAAAADAKGQKHDVRVMESLKSGWRFVDNKPGSIVIEKVLCRPDFDAEKRDPSHAVHFQIRYITFRYDGQRWHFAERTGAGIWESDDAFPAHALFPPTD